MNNIYDLPAATTFTVEQALDSAKGLNLSDVFIVGYDKDGCLVVRSSRMTRESGLWLVESAKKHVMEITDAS